MYLQYYLLLLECLGMGETYLTLSGKINITQHEFAVCLLSVIREALNSVSVSCLLAIWLPFKASINSWEMLLRAADCRCMNVAITKGLP
jgi:hypothetical protein